MNWKRMTLKFQNKCKGCGKTLEVGAQAYGGKEVGKKWKFLCGPCFDNEMAKPEAKQTADLTELAKDAAEALTKPDPLESVEFEQAKINSLNVAIGAGRIKMAELEQEEPEEEPKTTLEQIAANARWRW